MKTNQNVSKDIKRGLSIIIPVVNEERNIRPLLERITLSLSSKEIEYEIIFIDDHSQDGTEKIIKVLQKKYPIKFYVKKGKKGKAYSLIEGFSYAQYELVAMIDGDLQYPPEAILSMTKKIKGNVGIVVANRKEVKTSFKRKIISNLFSYPFGKFLHGFSCDVQSGLKVFKKEIIERITLSPGPWSFDLEFLVKARNAGYAIASIDITFEKRKSETPKISILPAALEIGWSALKLKLATSEIIPFHRNKVPNKGKGFHFKGVEFIHHSDLDHKESAVYTLVSRQKLVLFLLLLIILLGLLINGYIMGIVVVGVITLIYFADLLFNLFLILRNFAKIPEVQVFSQAIEKKDKKWPMYTILCPLYYEWEVLPQFVTAMSRLDYPKNKLQVLLLLEEDDKETIKHAQNYQLPDYFEIIVVPHSLPKTKPKALNYGMKYVKGEYVVIYDAEDVPDSKQLKKVVVAFDMVDKKTICIQAKLNFYNPHHNILTRIFTAEYSLWFDLVLTGLQSIFAPIPLGGTSNHFKTKDLYRLKGWDSFNVTEDCDLGMRLAKHGYRTALINSVTLEEANSDLKNWFEQRTRWIKGYIQTYLVHMRDPKKFMKDWHEPHLLTFQLVVGGKILSMFINPFMWITTIVYFAFRASAGIYIQKFFPAPILYMGVFSLVFGNFLYMYYYMIGCAKRGHYDIIKYVFIVPFYWLAMSVAAWKAVIQLIQKPHFWPKTIHGYHLDSDRVVKQATDVIGEKLVDTNLVTQPVDVPSTSAQDYSAPAPALSFQKSVEQSTWSIRSLSTGTLLLGAMMLANFLNFLFNAFLGRAISFEDFGLLTLINTFWAILNVFTSSLNATVNHKVAYLSAKGGDKASTSFLLYISKKLATILSAVAIIWIVLSPFLANFFQLPDMVPIILFTPVIFLAFFSSLGNGYLLGNFQFLLVGIIIILTALAKFLSATVFVKLGFDSLTYLAIPISIATYFISVGLFVGLKVKSVKGAKAKNYGFPKRFFAASIVSGLSISAFLTMDVILAKHFLSPKLAGEYAFLSLVGKMIFYFGSLLNIFMNSFISRDMGANRDPNKSFYRILAGTVGLTAIMYFCIGIFGSILVPILFGAKAYPILPYLSQYALAISLYVISNCIISYHLVRHHYSFSVTALLLSTIMSMGIVLFHNTIASMTRVILMSSILSLFVLSLLHLLQRNGRFFFRNIVDLLGLFLPLPEFSPVQTSGKRILIFNWRDTKHRYAGGAEVYIHELAKRWVKAGHQVTVFCGNDGNCLRNEIIEGIQIIRRGGFYFVYFWAILYHLLRFRGQYDVIIDSENGIPFFSPLFAKGKKFLLIHHIHQEVFRKSLTPPLSWIATFMEMKLMPFVYKNVEAITVSPSSKKEILDRKLTSKDPTVIYNGVDLRKFKPGRKSAIPLILYLGRLKYYKSLHVFIHAARKILTSIPKAQFVIAGDGEEKDNLIKLAKKLSIFDKITFLGKVSEEQKIDLYQKAWVFVNPSFMEGWGITSIEANACGTPVVASNVPGLRDSVNNPHSGLLVPYGSVKEFTRQIKFLLKDDSFRAKLSIQAIYWAQQFDWQKSAEKSLKLFNF